MHKIAFIVGDRFVYWTPIILAFGVLAAVCMFLALHLGRTGKATAAFVAVPLAIGFSLVLGRLVYWACVPERYASVLQALTDYRIEGFALAGIGAGCALAACLVRLVGLSESLPAMLDSMSLAGLLGLSVARLNHFFNNGNRAVSRIGLPGTLKELWPAPVFLLQAVAAAVLFVSLLIFFLTVGRKRAGDTCLLAGFFHGAVQIILDAARYDTLRLPGLRAATLPQICGLALMLLAAVLFCVRMVRTRGWRAWYPALWIPFAAAFAASAFMACLSNDMGLRRLAVGSLAAAAALMLAIYILSITHTNKCDGVCGLDIAHANAEDLGADADSDSEGGSVE